ncbi:methylmalonyl-CoA mutase family protein [Larkinella rosea]|uniref:Methylmalonyl-CoA mutase n=1 Tax=Larkinella rosea TaxID=2025312 RepID=A0A3P1BNI8_9BACT|nr:methylmalonyl-CoA mutase family protein [Larkinella rosea]RRB02376.1 methylmalonyl-CoA mutase [Larkinella rosea]
MPDLTIQKWFPSVTKAEWIQQVTTDLKGKSIESLNRTTLDGLETEPFYTAEDLANQSRTENRSTLTTGRPLGWLTVPDVPFTTEQETNTILRDWLTKGADGFRIDLSGFEVAQLDWLRLLNGLKLSETPVWLRTNGQSGQAANALNRFLPYQLKGGFFDEPIARRLQFGNDPKEAIAQVTEATRLTLNSPQFRTITAGSTVFHNSGATATQELAFTLNTVVDLYDRLTDSGLTVEQIAPKTALSVSVGTSYFTEIAKLRALRILWQRLLAFYDASFIQAGGPIPQSSFIHAQTSTFYDSTATPYNNLLRATTEAMAAVIGGCDSLTIHPYDAVFEEPDAFSNRIARNISILLKEEAHLDKTLDPSAGSYYLETLTKQLVGSAWDLFLKVENLGGLLKAVESGFIQEEIDKAYQAKVDAVENGRILVGVTKFRSNEAAVASPERSPTNEPGLAERRLAERFE